VDQGFMPLKALKHVGIVPALCVVPQVFYLRGQLAQAVDQSGQRNGHHD